MNKFNNYLFVFGLIGFIGLFISCSKPFEGVTAIVSNSYIKQRIGVQVLDANPKATNPYPANPSITLSGDAVKKGLIYTGDGEVLTETPGNAKLVNNAITLAIKPNTSISSASPLKFTIEASAAGFITNSQEVIVRSSDSLQYVQVKLLKPSALPTGVTIAAAQDISVVNGTSPSAFTVKVTATEPSSGGGTVTQTQAQAVIPAGTIFKDKLGAAINKSSLAINITNFSSNSPDASAAISGGLNNVATSASSSPQGFISAGAVNITFSLGGTEVKSFSNPIPVELFLGDKVFNPGSKSLLKEGDSVPVWSKDEGSSIWVKEPNVTVVKDPVSGRLKTDVLVTHLSTWMVAFSQPACNQPLTITYTSASKEEKAIFVRAVASEGNQQILQEKTVSVQNGDKIVLDLPSGVDYVVRVYEGSNDSAPLINSIVVPACSSSISVNNTRTNTNPSLFFDLETVCQNGTFRYSGPIEYKLSTNAVWEPFTPSNAGTLTTTLLEWNKTYDFRIIYKGTEFRRGRQVLQSEFRQSGANWTFWGKTDVKQTFFNAPTSCN